MGLLTPAHDRTPTVALVAQSGAMLSAIREAARHKGVGFTHLISTGNEAVVGVEDFLAELIDDAPTRVIALFVEQFRHPRLLLALTARARAAGKPIVLFHSGRSSAARSAAQSHTGALAGDFRIMAALVAHQGVVLVDGFDELVDTIALLARCPAPPTAGVGVITNSGAFCGIAHDVAADAGLAVAKPSAATLERLRAMTPPFTAPGNPLDLGTLLMRSPHLLAEAARTMLGDDAIGSLVIATVLGTPAQALDKANAVLPVLDAAQKPVAFGAIGGDAALPADFLARVDEAGTPFFRSPERALRAMAHLGRYARVLQRWRTREAPRDIAAAPLPGRGTLPEHVGKTWLAAAGIPVPAGALATSAAQAAEIAARIGYPVVVKAQAAALAHKSDAGGVMLNITDAAALAHAWDAVHAAVGAARPDVVLDGVLVERMSRPGVEMLVGGRRDPAWGAVLMVGVGGVFVEALDDVRLLAPDATRDEIIDAIAALRGAKLLGGLRGAPRADVAALADIVGRVAALMRATPQLAEIDLNPVVVHPDGQGASALDALVVIDDGVDASRAAADPSAEARRAKAGQ